MTTYHSHKVNLSEGQMKKLSTAHNNKSGITIRLSKSDLTGNDSLMLTKRQIKYIHLGRPKSGAPMHLPFFCSSKLHCYQIRNHTIFLSLYGGPYRYKKPLMILLTKATSIYFVVNQYKFSCL